MKKIIEIDSIEKVLEHLDPDTHLFWDIDNTLLMPTHDFGSEHWENTLSRHFIEEGVEEQKAIQRASHLWRAIQSVSEIKLVEPNTANIFLQAQKKGHPHFAITARSSDFHEVTLKQLQSLGIHFPGGKHLYNLPEQAHYFQGVFFCGDILKGEVLQAYIDVHRCRRIVMVDDNRRHLEKAVEILPIPFIGLRYGYLDTHRKNYTPDPISKLLFKAFNHPLACKYLKRGLLNE